MSITSRIRIGIVLAIACLALTVPGSAKAQVYGGYGYRPYYGYAYPSYPVRPSYGYRYNRGYSYGPRMAVARPQTYNNLYGVAGLINQYAARRSNYYGYGRTVRRRW